MLEAVVAATPMAATVAVWYGSKLERWPWMEASWRTGRALRVAAEEVAVVYVWMWRPCQAAVRSAPKGVQARVMEAGAAAGLQSMETVPPIREQYQRPPVPAQNEGEPELCTCNRPLKSMVMW